MEIKRSSSSPYLSISPFCVEFPPIRRKSSYKLITPSKFLLNDSPATQDNETLSQEEQKIHPSSLKELLEANDDKIEFYPPQEQSDDDDSSKEEDLDELPRKPCHSWDKPLPEQEECLTSWFKYKTKGFVPQNRSSFVAQKFNEMFILVHGGHTKEADLSDTFTLDLSEKLWRKVNKVTDQIKLSLVGHKSITLSRSQGSPDYVLIFGGWDGKSYSNHGYLLETSKREFQLDHYEVQETSEWRPTQMKPVGRRDHTFVQDTSGHQVFLIGGWDPMRWNNTDFDFNQLWVLKPDWSWQRIQTYGTQPLSRRGHTMLYHKQELIMFGGLYGYSRYLDDLFIITLQNKTWREIKKGEGECEFWPLARAWHSACMLEDALHCSYMYVFGGMLQNGSFASDFLKFNPYTNTWKVLLVRGETPESRCSHACVKIGQSSIVIFGGIGQEENSQEFNGLSYMMNLENQDFKKANEPYRPLSLEQIWIFETVKGAFEEEIQGLSKGTQNKLETSIFGEDPTISQFGLPPLPSQLYVYNESNNIKLFSPLSFPHNGKNIAYNEQREKLKEKLNMERQVRISLKGII